MRILTYIAAIQLVALVASLKMWPWESSAAIMISFLVNLGQIKILKDGR